MRHVKGERHRSAANALSFPMARSCQRTDNPIVELNASFADRGVGGLGRGASWDLPDSPGISHQHARAGGFEATIEPPSCRLCGPRRHDVTSSRVLEKRRPPSPEGTNRVRPQPCQHVVLDSDEKPHSLTTEPRLRPRTSTAQERRAGGPSSWRPRQSMSHLPWLPHVSR